MKKFKTNERIFLSHDKTNPRPRQSYAIKSEKGYYPARRRICDPPEGRCAIRPSFALQQGSRAAEEK